MWAVIVKLTMSNIAASLFGTTWPLIRERLVSQGLQSDGTDLSHRRRGNNRIGIPKRVLAAGQDGFVGEASRAWRRLSISSRSAEVPSIECGSHFLA